ncbi:MAG: hypothetical protein R2814_05945 [Flavobacteriaceae bacterium]
MARVLTDYYLRWKAAIDPEGSPLPDSESIGKFLVVVKWHGQ